MKINTENVFEFHVGKFKFMLKVIHIRWLVFQYQDDVKGYNSFWKVGWCRSSEDQCE